MASSRRFEMGLKFKLYRVLKIMNCRLVPRSTRPHETRNLFLPPAKVIWMQPKRALNVHKSSSRVMILISFFSAVLTTPSEDITELNKAIISCQNLVNREWELRQSNNNYDTIQINVGKVTVPAGNLFDQGM